MARRHRVIALLAGWLATSVPALADVARGQTAASVDDAAAFNRLLPAARTGDAQSQFLVGQMLEHGAAPGSRDPRQAVRWYRKAAAQDHGDAQYALSRAYAAGAGVPRNRAEALAWLERAAANDSVPALLDLAARHRSGQGVARDEGQAAALIRRAALMGSAEAQYQYAESLDTGTGTARDPRAAWDWYRRAAENGHPAALQRVGRTGQTATATLDEIVALWLAMAAQRKAPPTGPSAVSIRGE